MKYALFPKIFALLICLILSEIVVSQTSEPILQPFSSSSPFDPPDENDKKNQEEDVIYDTANIVTPSFFDILSSPTRPFSSNQINNHSGSQTVDDPGKDCDAPIDENIVVLFIAAVCFRLRQKIKEKFILVTKLILSI